MSLTTCLWFDGNASDAAEFYCNIFENSKINNVTNYPDEMPGVGGQVMTVEFEIMGQPFLGLNGGPQFPHTEAVSFQVPCTTQDDIDRYWEYLIADGGAPGQCGWCKDKFGVSWQVVSDRLGEFFSNPATAGAVAGVLQQQTKIIIADLAAAAAG